MKHNLACIVLLLLTNLITVPHAFPQMQKATGHSARQTAVSADKIWADLMEGNRRFVEGKPKAPDLVSLRRSLAETQHPKAIVLSCSDSRVPPEIVFDQSLGDLFVVRAAGNIADAIGLGSMEYAFQHLGSTVLVVLGHTKCGAVTAACSGDKMATPNLQAMVDKIEPAVTAVMKLKDSAKGDSFVEMAIQENVHQSVRDLVAHSEVLRHGKDQGKLTVFEAEYHLDTGEVVRLDKVKR